MLPRIAMMVHKIAELKTNVSENIDQKDKVKCGNKVLTIRNHKQTQKNIVCGFFLPQNIFF